MLGGSRGVAAFHPGAMHVRGFAFRCRVPAANFVHMRGWQYSLVSFHACCEHGCAALVAPAPCLRCHVASQLQSLWPVPRCLWQLSGSSVAAITAACTVTSVARAAAGSGGRCNSAGHQTAAAAELLAAAAAYACCCCAWCSRPAALYLLSRGRMIQ